MINNKICNICYNKDTNDMLKCKQCKHEVCDECYANITFNNEEFILYFNDDKSLYNCPYCKKNNVLSTNINNSNTNNKLIKLLLKKMNNNNIEFNNLVDDINNVRNYNKTISDENEKFKNQLHNLRSFNYEILAENRAFKNEINIIKSDLEYNIKKTKVLELEYKQPPNNNKLEKIEQLLKKTSKRTILYDKITCILNE